MPKLVAKLHPFLSFLSTFLQLSFPVPLPLHDSGSQSLCFSVNLPICNSGSHKSQSNATLITNTVKGMLEDIGLSWGLQKCAAVDIKKGKIMPSSELPLTSGDNISVLGEDDYYKFLRKFETSVQFERKVLELAREEFVRRLRIIWSSPLTVSRKVKATKCFAILVLQYYYYHMWSSDWPISSLQELDRNARKIIWKFKGKHYHESNPLPYLPPEREEKDFQEITQLYKTTKIKTAHHIITGKDPRFRHCEAIPKL